MTFSVHVVTSQLWFGEQNFTCVSWSNPVRCVGPVQFVESEIVIAPLFLYHFILPCLFLYILNNKYKTTKNINVLSKELRLLNQFLLFIFILVILNLGFNSCDNNISMFLFISYYLLHVFLILLWPHATSHREYGIP